MHSAIIEVGSSHEGVNKNIEFILDRCERIDYYKEDDTWLINLECYFQRFGMKLNQKEHTIDIMETSLLREKVNEWMEKTQECFDYQPETIDLWEIKYNLRTLGGDIMFLYNGELMNSTEFFLIMLKRHYDGDTLYIGKVFDYHF